MKNVRKLIKFLITALSYVLVAVIALTVGYSIRTPEIQGSAKLVELQQLLEDRFIGQVDPVALEDGAAAGMVASLGDRWSYYIPASEFEAHMEQMENAYVGIGVTISTEENELGFEVLQVEPGSGALAAGIIPGDYITHVEGTPVLEIGVDEAKNRIRGEENTTVNLTVKREDQVLELTVTRQLIQVVVASAQMLEGNIGLVTIKNFDDRCASETIAAIDSLVAQGATALIFDVRNNPGGYKHELVQVLDYLLPEGALFRSFSYTGKETVDESDDKCLKLPMAVLVNENSFSAAEFFAAALEEYDWAVTVGAHTVGKSYFQQTLQLSDGSAVGLSVGKYCTPKGVSLAEVGGLAPNVVVDVDDETFARIYAGLVPPQEDPQILAAIAALEQQGQ